MSKKGLGKGKVIAFLTSFISIGRSSLPLRLLLHNVIFLRRRPLWSCAPKLVHYYNRLWLKILSAHYGAMLNFVTVNNDGCCCPLVGYGCWLLACLPAYLQPSNVTQLLDASNNKNNMARDWKQKRATQGTFKTIKTRRWMEDKLATSSWRDERKLSTW